jgi:hypothetical protein
MEQSIGETIEPGTFVQVRGRPWLVEALQGVGTDLQTLSLSCIADDAQGERVEILWDAEIGAAVLDEDRWRNVEQGLPDSPEVLAAHLRTICRELEKDAEVLVEEHVGVEHDRAPDTF